MRPHPYLEPMQVRGRIEKPQPLGLPVINMAFNELPWPPAPAVAAALDQASHHAQSYGSPFCDTLRDALEEAHGLDADRIICTNGSEEMLDVIGRVFARPGDEILISAYGYIQFALTANRVGASLVKAPEADYTTDINALLDAVTDRTRILYLANPNNPTGTYVPVDTLAALADGLRSDVLLVLDLAYGEFAPEGYCAAVHTLVDLHENVVVTRTFSKAYGLAGARIGWCHGPEWIIPALYAARAMGPVNALAQAAAIAALQDVDTVNDRVATIVSERTRLTQALVARGCYVLDSHTNFLLFSPPDRDPHTTEAIIVHLFDTAGLVVTRTREAGLEDFLRVSISLPVHNDMMLAALDTFLTQSA